MRDLNQDQGGIVALVALAVVVLFVVILLLILFNDVQKLIDDLSRILHPFGSALIGTTSS